MAKSIPIIRIIDDKKAEFLLWFNYDLQKTDQKIFETMFGSPYEDEQESEPKIEEDIFRERNYELRGLWD